MGFILRLAEQRRPATFSEPPPNFLSDASFVPLEVLLAASLSNEEGQGVFLVDVHSPTGTRAHCIIALLDRSPRVQRITTP